MNNNFNLEGQKYSRTIQTNYQSVFPDENSPPYSRPNCRKFRFYFDVYGGQPNFCGWVFVENTQVYCTIHHNNVLHCQNKGLKCILRGTKQDGSPNWVYPGYGYYNGHGTLVRDDNGSSRRAYKLMTEDWPTCQHDFTHWCKSNYLIN